MKNLKIAGKEFQSRLFLGTGKFGSPKLMEDAVLASGSELVTVALKRIDMETNTDGLLTHLQHPHINLLPNTSGARNAKEAVFAAQLAREALETNWLKLEIHPDPRYLMPDPVETLIACEELARLGFVVLPYIHADPVLCKRLEDAGTAAVMPLGAFIDIVGTVIQRPMLGWEKSKVNLALRLEYADYNQGKFKETNGNIADDIWAIVPGIAFRPVGTTVLRFNYRYQQQQDLLGNPPSKTGVIQLGISSYF